MIRLFVVEDHPIIVDGLKQRFRVQRDRIQIAGWSNDPKDFTTSVSGESFDIIILDLWLPDMDPEEIFCMIQKRFPDKPVVVLTNERSTYWIKVMMKKGAKAYLIKDIDKRELKATLEKVYTGKTVFPDMLLSKPPSYEPDEFLFQDDTITPSELAIVSQLSKGELLKDIATRRCTTVSAIEKKIARIRKKVNVKTNPELIRILMENKLI